MKGALPYSGWQEYAVSAFHLVHVAAVEVTGWYPRVLHFRAGASRPAPVRTSLLN